MYKLNLQLFGGRGSGGGNNPGGAKAAAGSGKTQEREFNKEFTPKDLKVTEKDQYGDNLLFNSSVGNWSRELSDSLKPGDVITITQNRKDGTERSTKITYVGPNPDKDSQLSLLVKRTGESLSKMYDMTPTGKTESISKTEFAALVGFDKSKVKSIKVDVKRKK